MSDATNNTPPASGGLKSTLKIVVPVVALMAVIFGVTFISHYIPPEDPKGGGEKGKNEPVLRFFTSARHWDPADFHSELGVRYRGMPLMAPSAQPTDPELPFRFDIQNRIFPYFYELQSDTVGPKNSAIFWFENPHQKSVTMQLQGVSCGSCSAGRVAAIPPEVTRQLLQMSGISALPQGLVTGLPVGMAGPAANLHPDRLQWEHHSFRDTPHASYKVPAANNHDGWSPQWGILELQFSVGTLGPKQPPLTADFATVIDGTQQGEINRFVIACEGVNPFELSTSLIDIGDISENSEPRKYEVVVYSTTRGPNRNGPGEMGDLRPPSVNVQGGERGQVVAMGEPVRVPEAELPFVAKQVLEKTKRYVRVESAYRYTLTVNPKLGESRIDIGLLDREIWFASTSGESRKLQIKGMVRGQVWLDDNLTEVSMQGYSLTQGESRQHRLITARPGVEVVVVRDECQPKELQITLEKDPQPPARDRGYYWLKVRMPGKTENPKAKAGTWSGEIVLEVKGPAPQRIRIPVKGRAELR
jgi:hypothetical protein